MHLICLFFSEILLDNFQPAEIKKATKGALPPMRAANTYALDAVGNAQNITAICICNGGNANAIDKANAIAGKTISLTTMK